MSPYRELDTELTPEALDTEQAILRYAENCRVRGASLPERAHVGARSFWRMAQRLGAKIETISFADATRFEGIRLFMPGGSIVVVCTPEVPDDQIDYRWPERP